MPNEETTLDNIYYSKCPVYKPYYRLFRGEGTTSVPDIHAFSKIKDPTPEDVRFVTKIQLDNKSMPPQTLYFWDCDDGKILSEEDMNDTNYKKFNEFFKNLQTRKLYMSD